MNNLEHIEPAAPSLERLAFTADQLGPQPAPPRAWHVPNMVPAKAVTLLQGDGGTGKSLLALQLAVATFLGRPWLGQEVRQGRALYLSAEDDRDEVHRRLEAIAALYGVRLADLSGLKVIDVTGNDCVLAAADRTGRLLKTDCWDDFVCRSRAWAPALVVIDNLADVFAGEENSRPQARQFIAQLQGLTASSSAAVILLGHPSIAGMASGTGSSGSTAWNNSVRSRLYLKPADGDATFRARARARGDTGALVLTVMKSNYGPSDVELRLRWSAGAFAVDGGTEVSVPSAANQVAETLVDELFLELLTTHKAQGRYVSPNKGHTYAPSRFSKDPLAKGVASRGFEAAMTRLFSRGLIAAEPIGPPSRRTQRIVRSTAAAE